ncbi:hypothetical protein DCC85_00600 [Paenibacillus sp. CAA11]|nr:hypothetical protein DCC85_00600 [Paenibacillus sp. CAA11]
MGKLPRSKGFRLEWSRHISYKFQEFKASLLVSMWGNKHTMEEGSQGNGFPIRRVWFRFHPPERIQSARAGLIMSPASCFFYGDSMQQAEKNLLFPAK